MDTPSNFSHLPLEMKLEVISRINYLSRLLIKSVSIEWNELVNSLRIKVDYDNLEQVCEVGDIISLSTIGYHDFFLINSTIYHLAKKVKWRELVKFSFHLVKGEVVPDYTLGWKGACEGGDLKVIKFIRNQLLSQISLALISTQRHGTFSILENVTAKAKSILIKGLRWAAQSGNISSIEYLLSKGVLDTDMGCYGAAKCNNFSIVMMCIEKIYSASAIEYETHWKMTLTGAARGCHPKLIEYISSVKLFSSDIWNQTLVGVIFPNRKSMIRITDKTLDTVKKILELRKVTSVSRAIEVIKLYLDGAQPYKSCEGEVSSSIPLKIYEELKKYNATL